MSSSKFFEGGERLVEIADGLRSILLDQTSAAERNRCISEDVIGTLGEAGFLRLSVPPRLGGLGASVSHTARVVASLARGCPSTAWILCVSNSNSLAASLASQAIQREVFAYGVPIICGASSPSGASRQAAGGRLADGRWAYSSGCRHATWGAFSLSDRSPEGAMLGATIYVPMTEMTIEDTWHVAGLKATGSNTAVATGLFVPDHRYALPGTGIAPREAPEFVPIVPYFRALLLGVMVGAAEAILERVTARSKSQGITFTTYARQADSHTVQREVGEAAVTIQTGRLLMSEVARSIDTAAGRHQQMSPFDRAQSRAQTSFAAHLLIEAVGRLVAVAGSWAFAESNQVQQFWRDINVAASHAILIPRVGYEIFGRDLLGISPNIAASDDLI
jgi:3-hydroxy-9,10-secoandrosta-1,3,5(10)-triene-9,17-dione monooxygenase